MNNKAVDIRFIVADVDGVLTDGGLYYSGQGEALKKFNVKDGQIVNVLRDKGIRLGVLSGRYSAQVQRRCEELNYDCVIQGSADKLADLQCELDRTGMSLSNVAFIGDDINDIVVLEKAGLSGCPADAVDQVRKMVDFVSAKKGGEGAFREFAEHILKRL